MSAEMEHTVASAATLEGTSLHTGEKVSLTIKPAPAGHGFKFRRVDLDGQPEVEARVQNVSETNRSTTLSKGNIKIHTVEHVLATLSGFQIDNAIVEIDSNRRRILATLRRTHQAGRY